MRLRGQSDDLLEVRLNVEELVLLKNVLHEVCHGMSFSDGDFHTIFGSSRREVEGLLMRATVMLDKLRLTPE